uniref:Cytochrome b-c1 complex subunit 6 n=1 Tax=Globodera rostochiensis TaxID=31243 RepID=A0A914I4T8_GLORO
MPKEEVPEGVDQLAYFREQCEPSVAHLKQILDECNARVQSKSTTTEICHMEIIDYVNGLDHCAKPKAFKALK